MRAYTITCHDVYNYGASLQAYSLQRYLLAKGIDSWIIDYKPDYLSRHFSLWGCSHPKYDKFFVRTLYNLALLPERLHARKKKKVFDEFTKSFLRLTPKRYSTNEEIKSDKLCADLFIAGSDQIWNTLFKNGLDKAFYLDFASSGRKISYAASFATDKIYNDAGELVKNMIGGLDAISVRESSAQSLLRELGVTNSVLVADPVFLTERAEWDKLLDGRNLRGEKFIFLYDCERSNKLKEIAIYLKRKLGLPIYCIGSTSRDKYWDKDLRLIGPLEFLEYIRAASFVLTNSFHATAFSVIYEKNFYVVNRSSGINARVRDFLNLIGLGDRLITTIKDINTKTINYISAKKKLSELQSTSKQFLSENIFRKF